MTSSLCYLDTEYTACSVEACPQNGQLFVCGTYQVLSTNHTSSNIERGGTCKLYKIIQPSQDKVTPEYSLRELDIFDTNAAIPDIKWRQNTPNGIPMLAVADSHGKVTILNMTYLGDKNKRKQEDHDNDSANEKCPNQYLARVQTLDCNAEDFDSRPLCLSLDWSDKVYPANASLAVSLSNGYIATFSCLESQDPAHMWRGHDFEAWIAAWNYHDPSILYTGGDDCKLKGWDFRAGVGHPIFVNKRFGAGVTTISTNPKEEHMIVVGSYDEKVRIFDSRNYAQPLESIPVGGGVWRTKWNPRDPKRIMVACMHDGFKIISYENDQWTLKSRFDEHKSLAYGCDWVVDGDKRELAASCSFYDHALHLWNPL